MTEIQTLKAKCYNKNGSVKKGATAADLTRLKQLQDGEPLSAADLEVSKAREEKRAEQDKKDYEARQTAKANTPMTQVPGPTPVAEVGGNVGEVMTPASLDPPPEHPRIKELKDALRIFTQIEANDTRPDDFVLFARGVCVTAGDVRRARKAMML